MGFLPHSDSKWPQQGLPMPAARPGPHAAAAVRLCYLPGWEMVRFKTRMRVIDYAVRL